MRCERCGREISNSELWQIAADPKAPATWSMRVLCWDCREHPPTQAPAKVSAESAAAPTAHDAEPVESHEAQPQPLDGAAIHEAAAPATPPPA